VPCQLGRAFRVGIELLDMLAAVELDCELVLGAGEIDDSPSDGMLAAEFPGDQLVAQGVPQDALDIRGVAAQASCDFLSWSESASTPRLTLPSPPLGGGEGVGTKRKPLPQDLHELQLG
jgi:hypothetical protein